MSEKVGEIKECAVNFLSGLDKDALMNLTARMLAEVICEKLSLGENAMVAEDYKALKEWFREYVFKIATEDTDDKDADDDDDDDDDVDDASDAEIISDDEEDIMAIPEEVKNASEEWKKSYKTVCFAKGTSKFPWWPVYIFDPSTMDPGGLRDGALKEIEKKHIVYYYGCDAKSAFNYVPSKNIMPYNDEMLKEYKGQKMNKNLLTRYEEGLKLAAADSKLEPDERASTMVSKFAKRLATLSKQQEKRRKQKIRERKAIAKEAKQAKKGKTATKRKATTKGKTVTKAKGKVTARKSKAAATPKKKSNAKSAKKVDSKKDNVDDDDDDDDEEENDGMAIQTDEIDEKEKVVDREDEEDEEEDVNDDDDDDDDDEDYEAESSKSKDKKKEKVPAKSVKSQSKSSLISDSESDSESKKKKEAKKSKADAKEKKKQQEKVEAKKKSELLAKQKKEEKEKVDQRKQQILQQESKVDRAKRLTSLLGLHSKKGGSTDIDKCVKTLEKLDKMDLNLEELKQSEAALMLNSLKKHTNSKLAKAAGELRIKWKQMFIKSPAPPANTTDTTNSTVANPPVPPSSDDKEDEISKSSATKRRRVVDDEDGDEDDANKDENNNLSSHDSSSSSSSSSIKKAKQEEVAIELKVYDIGCRNIALKMFQSIFVSNIRLINDLEALVWDIFDGKPQSEFTSAVQWLMINCKAISSDTISITDTNKDAIKNAIETRSKENLKSSFIL